MDDQTLTVVVMAKPATAGRVKTRLIGRLTAEQAAAVHQAMLRCVLMRLAEHFAAARLVLAVDAAAAKLAAFPVARSDVSDRWECVTQGGGDLGDRMERLWRELAVGGEEPVDTACANSGPSRRLDGGDQPFDDHSRSGSPLKNQASSHGRDKPTNAHSHPNANDEPTPISPSSSPSLKEGGSEAPLAQEAPPCAPIVFFGVDSPDAPAGLLAALPGKLDAADVVLGRSSDGGYWTLGARRFAPAVLRGIDWGTSKVYHQSVAAARRAGLTVADAGDFHDVDEPADLDHLLARLQSATEPPLVQLREQLRRIITQGESS